MRNTMCAAVAALVLAPALSQAAVDWKGDLRYRHENIDQEGKPSRDRHRVRARIAASGSVAENIKAGVQLATGNDDPVSTNQSLSDGFSSKGIQLDQAYIDVALLENALNLVFGKMSQPWVKPGGSDLIFDGDLTPEGIAAKWSSSGEGLNAFANAGGFWVQERSATDDSFLFHGQVGVKADLGGANLTVGGGVYSYDEIQGQTPIFDASDSFGNSTTEVVDEEGEATLFYANDYTLFEGFVVLGLNVANVPVSLYGHYVVNNDASQNDTGYLLGASVGKVKEPGSFALTLDYRSVEKDAVLGVFTDSDSFGGGTDGEGFRLSGQVAVAKNTTLGATYFINSIDPDGKDTDYNRLQLDLAVKF